MTHISVALCTCNGDRYLEQQLESIAAQTRPPDELVVCDDVSEDETFRLLENFRGKATFPVRLRRNLSRVGVTRNFSNAIELCQGDFIALSDQDDWWKPEKLERIEDAFSGNPNTELVFSDLEIVDSELRALGYTMWEKLEFKQNRQESLTGVSGFATLLKRSVATGAATVFRANLRSRILPIPNGWMHDQWIAFIAAARGRIVALSEALVLYRQHEGNLIGGRKETLVHQLTRAVGTNLEEYSLAAAAYGELANRLRSEDWDGSDTLIALVREKIAHLSTRANLPENEIYRFGRVIREIAGGRYSRFSNGWRSAVRDLVL